MIQIVIVVRVITLDTFNDPNRFLIVEDDPNDALLIKRALQSNCCAAFVCRNPSEAQSYLSGLGTYQDRARYPMPDVILADLHIGQSSGADFVKWVRRQAAPFKDTTIILLTDSARPAELEAAKDTGAQNVYRKPTKLDDLRKLLADIADAFCPMREK